MISILRTFGPAFYILFVWSFFFLISELYINSSVESQFYMTNIRVGTMFRFVFRRKLSIFLFWRLHSIFDLIIILPCRLHKKLFYFMKCFMVISNHLLNHFYELNIHGVTYISNLLWMFWENSFNFSLNLIHFLWYLKFTSWTPTVNFHVQNYMDNFDYSKEIQVKIKTIFYRLFFMNLFSIE